jgi:STE24 endopeptidase
MRVAARNLLVRSGLALACLLLAGMSWGQTAGRTGCGTAGCAEGAEAAGAAAQASPEQAERPQPQSEQAYSLPPDKLAKARVLNKIRLTLDILGSLWGVAILWILLASRAAARLERWAEGLAARRWVQGLVFFAALIGIMVVSGLPLDVIGHIASRHYGISVQGWGGWWGDQGKSLAVSLVVGVPVLLLFNWMVRVSPRRYWLWTWAISIPLILASVFLEPLLLDPLFDKFEPLTATHPKLVEKLERVVARTGTAIPPQRMFLMKASAKTNGINAYVTGIGSSKRFVMWDTTTDRMPDDEILFIFGHESGHYVLHHIAKGLGASIAGMFFLFWICARLGEGMVRRFGARWQVDSVANRAGFLTLLLALSIAGFVLTPVSNAVSRHFEHQADVYGQEAIHGLVPDAQKTTVSSFNHLGESWLEDPNPSRIVEFWLYNHPSVKNRANFAAHYDPWANGGRGKYFR